MGPFSSSTVSLLYQPQWDGGEAWPISWGFTGKPWSMGGPDTPENPQAQVLENREALKTQLGYPQTPWAIPQQVHGHRVGRVGDAQLCQTDALLVLEPHQPAMVLTADCVPILLYDPVAHAGALIHAGWRGTTQQIAPEAVLALQNAKGCEPPNIRAVIGPAIGLCCFQISREVLSQLCHGDTQAQSAWEEVGMVQWDADMPHNPRVDLKALNAQQLRAVGVQQIQTVPMCTRCSQETLYSFRRGEDGRNGAFMVLR